MRAVNLLKDSTAAAKRSTPSVALILAGAAPVLAATLVIVGYTYEHSSVTSARGKLAAIQAEVAATPHRAATSVPGALASALQQEQRRSALDAALVSRIAWDQTLVQIGRILPSDVWLTQMSLISPDPADATAPQGTPNPQGFTLEGYTYSQNGVAHLLTRLQLLSVLSNITLASTTSNTVGTKPVVEFTVNAQINGPASAIIPAVLAPTTTTPAT